MKRLIYSVQIEIPSTDWGIGHPLRHIYWDFKDKIVEYKKRYADHCLADYKLFEDFGDFETFSEMSVYDNIQYYKLHLLKELAKEYDEVLYLDFDVIPMQPINFFAAFDLQSYLLNFLNQKLFQSDWLKNQKDSVHHNKESDYLFC